MSNVILIVALLEIAVPPYAQRLLELIGVVSSDSQECREGVRIGIVGGGSDVTTSMGQFRVTLPPGMTPGQTVTLTPLKEGCEVGDRAGLTVVVPSDTAQNPLKIRMRKTVPFAPKGSRPSPPSDPARLADKSRDGSVYLTRIVNPPAGERPQQSTIWLNADGLGSYVIDSITIRHVSYGACTSSPQSGARPPDARYTFEFSPNQIETFPLDPALVLSPKDRREVSFTLGLAPARRVDGCGGVHVAVHYHTPEGKRGRLTLIDLRSEIVSLAALLGRDILHDGVIVTPAGLQRGNDEGYDQALQLTFEYLELPEPLRASRSGADIFRLSDAELPVSLPRVVLTQQRIALNTTISKKGVLPQIVKRLRSGDPVAFDLCAGLSSTECDRAILDAATDPRVEDRFRIASQALTAAAIRHLITPSPALADLVVALMSSRNRYSPMSEVYAAALAYYPEGQWLDAILNASRLQYEGTSYEKTALWALYMRRGDLDVRQRELVEAFCWEDFGTMNPAPAAVKYLLWRGRSIAEIDEKLITAPPSLKTEWEVRTWKESTRRLRERYLSPQSRKH